MTPTDRTLGKIPDGREVLSYTLEGSRGLSVTVMTLGAALISLRAPDPRGRSEEVTLGFDNLAGYLQPQPYIGATVGRCANRIAGGRFELGGRTVELARNDGGRHHLHGGIRGFDKVVWEAEAGENRVLLRYVSPDGEEGYPGELSVTACYRLAGTGGGAGGVEGLELTYEARATAPTPVNLTNHTYWNLGGDGAGTILDHECTLRCSRYLPVDTELIPTGEIAVVDGTPMDFTRPHRFGERIGRTAGGYDHCFLVDGPIVEGTDAAGLRPALLAHDPKSGRSMEVLTTQPAIQLYTGNFLDGIAGRDGHVYVQHSGFCVEPEGLPDAVNRPSFPSPILLPGQTYRHTTIYRFSVGKE